MLVSSSDIHLELFEATKRMQHRSSPKQSLSLSVRVAASAAQDRHRNRGDAIGDTRRFPFRCQGREFAKALPFNSHLACWWSDEEYIALSTPCG